jgi:hypothetical protein
MKKLQSPHNTPGQENERQKNGRNFPLWLLFSCPSFSCPGAAFFIFCLALSGKTDERFVECGWSR